MPVTEIVPPESPLNEELAAPVLYLLGQTSDDDGWHRVAVDTIYKEAPRGPRLYVADPYGLRFEATKSDLAAWQEKYYRRAVKSGAVVLWISSAQIASGISEDTASHIEAAKSDETLRYVIGAGIRKDTRNRLKLQDSLAETNIQLHENIQDACRFATAMATSGN